MGLNEEMQLALECGDLACEAPDVRELSRATRTRALAVSARSRRSMRSSTTVWSSARSFTDASSSGASATRCQRNLFCIRVRSATKSLGSGL